ncbi:MAG: hypothetical protein K6360_04625 [Deltaproteobacteria bacterium]
MDSAIRALRLGADDYIVKPFDFELLCHAIDRILEHQKMRDEILLSQDRYHALDQIAEGVDHILGIHGAEKNDEPQSESMDVEVSLSNRSIWPR